MVFNFLVDICFYTTYIAITYCLYHLLVSFFIELYGILKTLITNQLANSNVSYRARFLVLAHAARWHVYSYCSRLINELSVNLKKKSKWTASFNRMLLRKIKR